MPLAVALRFAGLMLLAVPASGAARAEDNPWRAPDITATIPDRAERAPASRAPRGRAERAAERGSPDRPKPAAPAETVPAPPRDAATASGVRVLGDTAQTRFVLDLDRGLAVRAFTLADPYRVILDLPQVAFQLPAKSGEGGRGLVKAFRYGLVMAGASRIVIDLAGPARIERSFVMEAEDGLPARLVVELSATDRETFLRQIALENRPAARGPAPVAPSADVDPRPLVILDPGHGGIDSGTLSAGGEAEKTIVLDFARSLKAQLEKSGKYRVALTRADDSYISLGERVRLARSRQAALFISIHADSLAHRDGDAQGATVYTLSETASDKEAERLADAENRADIIAGVDLSAEPSDIADILIDLAQRETKNFSHQFARLLVNDLKSATRLHKIPLRAAGFKVLKAPDVPAVLLELGYVSNRDDLKQLMSESWRNRTAAAMAQSIEVFFARRVMASEGMRR